MTTVKNLVQQRGSIKGRLTRIQRYLDREDIDAVNHHDIYVRYDSLDEIFQSYNKVHSLIIGAIDDKEIEDHEVRYLEFEETNFRVKAKAEVLLNLDSQNNTLNN